MLEALQARNPMAQPAATDALQLKITLLGFRPPIWRRVLVPASFDLAKLHRVIQEAFGWEDYHLHAFRIHGVEFGQPDPEGWMEYQSERIVLAKLNLKPKTKFRYEYDFGDSWIHEITVEKILSQDEPMSVPVCLAGKRACPPEDSGGPWGFQDMLYAANNPEHPDHEEFKEYIDPDWNPEAFHLEAVNTCLRAAFKPRTLATKRKTGKTGTPTSGQG
jgi:hypothetical protein